MMTAPLAKQTAGSLGIGAESWEGGLGGGLLGTNSTTGSRDGVPRGPSLTPVVLDWEREVSLSRAMSTGGRGQW